MNIEKINNLVQNKLNKSDFYDITFKRNMKVFNVMVQPVIGGIYVQITTQHQTIISGGLKHESITLLLDPKVFNEKWNNENKLAQKIYKLIYFCGLKTYNYNGRLVQR